MTTSESPVLYVFVFLFCRLYLLTCQSRSRVPSHAPIHLVATEGVYGDDARKGLGAHVRRPHRVALIYSVRIDLRDSHAGMFLTNCLVATSGSKSVVPASRSRDVLVRTQAAQGVPYMRSP